MPGQQGSVLANSSFSVPLLGFFPHRKVSGGWISLFHGVLAPSFVSNSYKGRHGR